MAVRKSVKLAKKRLVERRKAVWKGSLKKGDPVMVISGGHKEKRPIKGQVGKVVRFTGDLKDRVVVEGLNVFTRHQRATAPGQEGGKIQKAMGLHVSNVMYYAEKIKRPVRLKSVTLADGKKVRGYINPENKEFVQLDA